LPVCYERNSDTRRLILLHIAGRGVAKDLERARTLLIQDPSQDCGV